MSSGRLQEVKNRRKSLNFQAQKVVAVAYRRWSFTRGSNCKVLTGKVLVFWIGGRLWEVVANERWLHMEVRLYSEMFITAVSVLFLIKLRWPKNKNLYDSETRLAALLVQNQSSRSGETPHMKGVGMLVGNFELNP